MFGLVVAVVVVVSAFWVYFDATGNKIGKVAGAKGMFNMSAGGWAAVTLLLWIVGFPAYIIKRSSLIESAKTAPAQVNRAVGFVALAFVGLPWIGLSVVGYMGGSLPACDSPNVQQIVKDIPAVKLAYAAGAQLANPGEASYDSQAEKRTCRVFLAKDGAQLPVTYTVSWHNRSNGQIWVQIVE